MSNHGGEQWLAYQFRFLMAGSQSDRRSKVTQSVVLFRLDTVLQACISLAVSEEVPYQCSIERNSKTDYS